MHDEEKKVDDVVTSRECTNALAVLLLLLLLFCSAFIYISGSLIAVSHTSVAVSLFGREKKSYDGADSQISACLFLHFIRRM